VDPPKLGTLKSVSVLTIKNHTLENGLSNTGFLVAVDSLKAKEYIDYENFDGNDPTDLKITENGWASIRNMVKSTQFRLETNDDVIPF